MILQSIMVQQNDITFWTMSAFKAQQLHNSLKLHFSELAFEIVRKYWNIEMLLYTTQFNANNIDCCIWCRRAQICPFGRFGMEEFRRHKIQLRLLSVVRQVLIQWHVFSRFTPAGCRRRESDHTSCQTQAGPSYVSATIKIDETTSVENHQPQKRDSTSTCVKVDAQADTSDMGISDVTKHHATRPSHETTLCFINLLWQNRKDLKLKSMKHGVFCEKSEWENC